jgi:hypothetical protein
MEFKIYNPLDDKYQGNTLIINNVYSDNNNNDKDDDGDIHNHTWTDTSQSRAQSLMLRNLEIVPSNLS